MRVGTVAAQNDGSKIITFTRYDDNDRVVVTFDFHMNQSLVFQVPEWCLPKEENYVFQGGVLLDAPAPIPDIQYSLNVTISGFKNMTFNPVTEQDYKGSFEYQAKAITGDFVLDGIRLHCISKIATTIQPVMYQDVRNHQGELIASNTLDTTMKRSFAITTIPVCERRYQLAPNVFSNTIEEIDKLLYPDEIIGAYRVFNYRGIDYTCLVDKQISEDEQEVWLDGNILQHAKIYTFTLNEV